jgi:hypothetical protein
MVGDFSTEDNVTSALPDLTLNIGRVGRMPTTLLAGALARQQALANRDCLGQVRRNNRDAAHSG